MSSGGWFGTSETVGGVASTTVRVNWRVAVRLPGSRTVTVIVADPTSPAAGVMVRVRFGPVPVTARLAAGTRAGLSDVAVTIRLFGSSASPTVIGTVTGWPAGAGGGGLMGARVGGLLNSNAPMSAAGPMTRAN